MTKQEFQSLFDDTIQLAVLSAEQLLGRNIPQIFSFRLHGAGSSGGVIDFTQIMDALYLNEGQFFRFITVGVAEVRRDETILFVGVSGHAPASFEKTRNMPWGRGPFHPVRPLYIKVLDQ